MLQWSATAMLVGLAPSLRHDGQELDKSRATGRLPVAAFLEVRGDWAHYKHCLSLTGWKGEGVAREMCFKCQALRRAVATDRLCVVVRTGVVGGTCGAAHRWLSATSRRVAVSCWVPCAGAGFGV